WIPSIKKYSRSTTRPGGRPVILDSQPIRFSQDNLNYYGQQLRAWKITRMNRLWYSEHALFHAPILKGTGQGWNARCMHHIDVYRGTGLTSESDNQLLAFVDGCV
ncbi:MAG: hypothetical protein ABL921_22685, partial [Pirellula sp.]